MRKSILIAISILCAPTSLSHAAEFPLFDIEARKAALQTEDYKEIKEMCMAKGASYPEDGLEPVIALKPTKAYGTDRGMNNFAWAMMLDGGRALAGDLEAKKRAAALLLSWAKVGALYESKVHHDPYYAIKRGMIPVIVTYAIIKDEYSFAHQNLVEAWIDKLVRKIDHKFGGDVDHNNHRYLADSLLMLWGAYKDDKTLYQKGIERFEIALKDMEDDGALPLEDRRGNRALWYIRQSIADLTLMAEVAKYKNDDLYNKEIEGRSLALLVNHFIHGVYNQDILLERASENYIPGPSDYFLQQDMGFLDDRGRRHYLGVGELYRISAEDEFSKKRFDMLMKQHVDDERPLIDDYIGGNATCFWAEP
tara:strand:+ start:5072 stop:6166 length:1095 start_codon:yes stop_codon:yes gene_type:complete